MLSLWLLPSCIFISLALTFLHFNLSVSNLFAFLSRCLQPLCICISLALTSLNFYLSGSYPLAFFTFLSLTSLHFYLSVSYLLAFCNPTLYVQYILLPCNCISLSMPSLHFLSLCLLPSCIFYLSVSLFALSFSASFLRISEGPGCPLPPCRGSPRCPEHPGRSPFTNTGKI